MDLTCFNWAQLVKKSTLPANAKYLALYLSTFMNFEHDVAWPAMDRIVVETGLSKPTARKWLDYLHEKRWLCKRVNVHPVMTKGGEQLQNEYEICIPEEILRGANDLPPQGKGGQTVDQRGANCSTKGGKLLTPNNNSNNNINNNTVSKPKRPTLNEVKAYCKERGNNVNPEQWMDHYISNGWKVGKNPMKDWRAAVRTWERSSVGNNTPPRNQSAPIMHDFPS